MAEWYIFLQKPIKSFSTLDIFYFLEHGLKEAYQNDSAFAHLCRMFRVLAYVPLDQVREYYNILITSEMFEAYRNDLLGYCTYFTGTYLGVPPNEPRYKMEEWNLYDRWVKKGDSRHN